MKCPFRKRIIKVDPVTDINSGLKIDGGYTTEEFEECYGKECPYYAPNTAWLVGCDCLRVTFGGMQHENR